ncbi:MAG: alpha/beta hydrolase, partial [Rubripirellula sp.]
MAKSDSQTPKTSSEPDRKPANAKRPETHQPRQPKPGRKKRVKVRTPMARFTIWLLRIIGFGYAAVLVTLVVMEERLVYPGAYMDDTSVAADEPLIESVSYNSTAKTTLTGRLLERKQGKNVLLFFHGNASKAKWLDSWLIQLSGQFDATVMAAEYRGFEDDTDPNERGVIEDCFAARDYLCDRYSIEPTDVVLYGRSLGGGCAVAVACRGGAKCVVLESTFDRMFNVAAERYPFVPVRLLMRNRYDSLAKLTAYKGPLVQIHSVDDTVIPFRFGKALFESAKSPLKHFIEVSGVDHIET